VIWLIALRGSPNALRDLAGEAVDPSPVIALDHDPNERFGT
jgi:hypothetical protein